MLAVIADHLLGYPAGGFVGVDIFFVISGFLITGLLLREQEKNGRISFADFYRRRIRRIVPVAVVVLAVTVAASWALFPTARAQTITWDGFWALVFGANWHYAAVGTDYMQAEGPVSPLQHFWSLAVEEQFYVAWPWIIVVVLGVLAQRLTIQPARARTVLASIFVLIIVASFAFAVWESEANPAVAYFSTVSRTWELAIGALLAVIGSKFANLTVIQRTLFGYIGLAGIAWSIFFVTPTMPFPGPWAIVPVLSTALVIAAGSGGEQRHLYLLTNQVSGYIGNISYSLYLWHFPVIILMGSLIPEKDGAPWIVMILGMFALSVASYHFVEDPIRKSGWLDPGNKRGNGKAGAAGHFSEHKTAVAALGVLTMVTVIFVTLAFTRFAPDEFANLETGPLTQVGDTETALPIDPLTPEGVLASEIETASITPEWPVLNPSMDELQGKFAPEWVDDKCLDTSEDNYGRCMYGDPTAEKTAVLLGDSVAISWMPGLRESLAQDGWNIQVLTLGQCPAIDIPVTRPNNAEGFTEACQEHQRWALEKVAQMRPEMVIVNSSLGTTKRIVGVEGNTDILRVWKEATIRSLEGLKNTTEGEVVLLSVPMGGKNLAECATKVSGPTNCFGVNPIYLPLVSAEEQAASQVAGVKFVNTAPWFCTSSNRCPPFVGTTPVFVDGAHITPSYSRQLAPVLKSALLGESHE